MSAVSLLSLTWQAWVLHCLTGSKFWSSNPIFISITIRDGTRIVVVQRGQRPDNHDGIVY